MWQPPSGMNAYWHRVPESGTDGARTRDLRRDTTGAPGCPQSAVASRSGHGYLVEEGAETLR
jgi:hypothetical protein